MTSSIARSSSVAITEPGIRAALREQQSSFLEGLRRVNALFVCTSWFARLRVSLPSFDQNVAAAHDGSERRLWPDLVDKFHHLRASTAHFFGGLPDEAWLRCGTVDGHTFSVRALACIIGGHALHHAAILDDRYRWRALGSADDVEADPAQGDRNVVVAATRLR